MSWADDARKTFLDQQLAYERAKSAPYYTSMPQSIGTGMEALVNQYNTAYQEAKAHNEKLYADMLGIVDQNTGQRAADIGSGYGEMSANAMQQLSRLGMSNTTVAPTLNMGIEREKQSSLNRLSDEMQGTRLGVMGQYGQQQMPNLGTLQETLTGAMSAFDPSQGTTALFNALKGIQY
jgi:hypothetical protein